MQLNGDSIYISLWPQPDFTKSQAVTNIIPHKLHTLYDDKAKEHRPPEVLLCFYTLDRYAMTAKFEAMQSTSQGWRTLGNSCLMEKDKAENCASLVYKLLQAGDEESEVLPSISQQSSKSVNASSWLFKAPVYSSKLCSASVIKSPDALAKLLTQAKVSECKKHPEIKNIVYPNETDVWVNDNSWCLVM